MATNDEEVTVWVGGLASQVTTEILWELFIQAGPLLDVKIPMDRETGEQRPFAFIAFKHPISGPYAERMFNGIKLYDKIIRVRYKGSQKFEQNKYHELYEGLLERLSTEQPEKYGNIFEEISRAKKLNERSNIREEEYGGFHDNRHVREYRQDINRQARVYPEYTGKYAAHHHGYDRSRGAPRDAGHHGNYHRERHRGPNSRY